MLPYISNNVIEISFFEHVNWIRGHPILEVNITNTLSFPTIQIFGH